MHAHVPYMLKGHVMLARLLHAQDIANMHACMHASMHAMKALPHVSEKAT